MKHFFSSHVFIFRSFSMLFIVAISSLNSFAQIPSWLPGNGLVAWYPLDSNALDGSGNGNNGTVYNSAPLTTDRFGNANAAYQFNGTNQYIGGSCTKFSATARSISLWYNGTSIGIGPPAGRNVFGYGGLTCGTSWIQVVYSNAYCLGPHCNNNNTCFNVSSPNANNVWHHWLITNDGISQTKFFLDGQLVFTTANYYNNTYVTGRDFTIGGIPSPTGYGSWTDGNVSPFQGKVDEVAVFNRALSDCEIRQIYYQTALAVGTQPATVTVPVGSKAQFSFKLSNDTCLTYQWQQDCGTGFVNLSNAGVYSGVNTDSLVINPSSLSLNNCIYRCIVSSCRFCADTTNAATLKVTPVGINEAENNLSVKLFPNPFRNQINISISGNTPLELVLYDVVSREVLRRKFTGSVSINTQQLSEGLYFFDIRSKYALLTRGKMMKE